MPVRTPVHVCSVPPGRAPSRPESLPLLYRVALDVANGMKHLASLRIMHADLKAENVLLARAEAGPDRPHGFTAKVGAQEAVSKDALRMDAGAWLLLLCCSRGRGEDCAAGVWPPLAWHGAPACPPLDSFRRVAYVSPFA